MERSAPFLPRALAYAALGATLSWSFTTPTFAAKNVMVSVPDYLLIETSFTIVQWLVVGPLTARAFRQAVRRDEPIRVAG